MAKTIYIFSCLILAILGIYDVYLLNIYAMDVPFWDTWDLLPQGGYKHVLNFYNENMQFFYFLISELIYKAADWNLRYFIFVNFGIYLFLIVVYLQILKYTQKDRKTPIYPLFLCVLLTPMLGYNWLWVFLVQTHTFILFFLLAVYFGFIKEEKKYSVYAYGFLLFLSIISMNIPLAVGGVLAYIIKEIINYKDNGLKKSLLRCLILILEISVLFGGLNLLTETEKFVTVRLSHSLFSFDFIENLSFYVVNSFSIFALADFLNWKIATIIMLWHFTLLAFVFFEQYKNKRLQALWAIMFSVLMCVSGIVAFRGGEVYSYSFSFIRHNETTFMLVPATLMILFLSKYKIARYYGAILLMLLMYGIANDIRSQRLQYFGQLFYKNGCLCLNHYYYLKTIDDWQCTMNFPIPRPDSMAEGTEKNLSFIRTIQQCY